MSRNVKTNLRSILRDVDTIVSLNRKTVVVEGRNEDVRVYWRPRNGRGVPRFKEKRLSTTGRRLPMKSFPRSADGKNLPF